MMKAGFEARMRARREKEKEREEREAEERKDEEERVRDLTAWAVGRRKEHEVRAAFVHLYCIDCSIMALFCQPSLRLDADLNAPPFCRP